MGFQSFCYFHVRMLLNMVKMIVRAPDVVPGEHPYRSFLDRSPMNFRGMITRQSASRVLADTSVTMIDIIWLVV